MKHHRHEINFGFLTNCVKIHKIEKYFKEVLRQKETAVTSSLSSKPSLSLFTGGVRDKLRVYKVMMNSLEKRNLSQEAADMCLDVLRQYGTKIPTNKAGIVARIAYNMGKIKTTMKSRTVEEAQSLRRMEDPVMIEQMSLLDDLITFLFHFDKSLFLFDYI